MRLNLRLILSLIFVVTLVSSLFTYYQVRAERRRRQQDLGKRAEVLGESLQESISPRLGKSSHRDLQRVVDRFANREHLDGIAVYDEHGRSIAASSGLTPKLTDLSGSVSQAISENKSTGNFLSLAGKPAHVYVLPLEKDDKSAGALLVVHDASYIDAQIARFWRHTFFTVSVEILLIALTTLLIVRWSVVGPIRQAAQWMKALRTGKGSLRSNFPDRDLFLPLAREVTTFAEQLRAARASAEKEAQLRQTAESIWTAERLSVHVRSRLGNSQLFVVSNREPYTHIKEGKSVRMLIPASGLVTALEPILHACDGTWIAHASGDADRETVDDYGRLRVPPDDPRYTLRRVWLTKEEEEGYYYGFANEGLWPLCHIAHTRPIFRVSDWEYYQRVNHKFAEALLEEMEGIKEPTIFVQDYHFALLPKLIKEIRPDARIAIFWHIPWPNPEAFGICPWRRQLLEGLLGADVIGFHIQSHCDNFLETVDSAVESRIEWERFAVNRENHLTVVKPFPISVTFTEAQHALSSPSPSESHYRAAVLKEFGLEAFFLGIGVDRVDYTKGIIERFLAIERFFDHYPKYQRQFSFVQIGAPSRTHIKRYHDLLAEVEAEAERINWRFRTDRWQPIVFLKRHHSHQEIERFYRASSLCMVTSLHDGMNLVAKEFVAARDDEDGVLILSRFTGACRELRDALIVNPYDTEEMLEAIRIALEMDPEQRHARMRHMRRVVQEQNVYRWAGNVISELCEVRTEIRRPAKDPLKLASGI